MSDLGALLRNARQQRGYSLDDIQEITKIRKRYLEALENGDHNVLPGSFYVRAFVKNYSEAVGLDPDEVLRLYQHEVPKTEEAKVEQVPARAPRRVKSQSSERWGKVGFNLLMWLFLFLIFYLVWYYVIKNGGDDAEKLDNKTPITEASAPPAVSGNPGGSPSSTVPAATPEPTQPPTTVTFLKIVGSSEQYEIGPAGKHTLEIKLVGGKSWLEVREGSNSGKKLFYANAEADTVQTFDLSDTLYVNVGRADYAQIYVDGVLVPDGDRANSKKLLLTPVTDSSTNAPSGTPIVE